MLGDEPAWWYGTGADDWRVRALKPVGHIYGWVTLQRIKKTNPYNSKLPVVCIGNLTAGGTGKTPLALLVATIARELDARPAFLTRGYKGHLRGPVVVQKEHHSATDVGDEPLLLACAAPTIVSRDRASGAKFVENLAAPADIIIMDDGLQNPALKKDLTIAVVDGARGFGNGEIIPAGPLRAPLAEQLRMVDAIVVNQGSSQENTGVYDLLRSDFPGPVLTAQTVARDDSTKFEEKDVVAFAGIGSPHRFFELLGSLGINIKKQLTFPDHHNFSDPDAAHILQNAKDHKALIMTTEKDWVRIRQDTPNCRTLREQSHVLPIRMDLSPQDRERLLSLISATQIR